jgi:hypothetical protein
VQCRGRAGGARRLVVGAGSDMISPRIERWICGQG